jgi:16S rRNA G966 N2-methylase RsmD
MRDTDTNADMSHQNTLAYKMGEIVNSIRDNGIKATIDKIFQRVNYRVKNVDFSTQNIYDLTLTGEYKDNGTALVSTSKDFLKMLLDDLEELVGDKISKDVFLDYGSGKGGAIIHAREFGFKKAIGIEFAKELDEIAKRNIQNLGINEVYSYFQDATTYNPPKDISIIYLFNPFDKVVMEKVAQNIDSLRDEYINDVYIIYGNPSCDVLDDYFTLLDKREYKSGARVNYYKL